MKISNKLYDILKWVCLVGLPAVAVFYGLIANTLDWQYTKEILTIMGGLETFIGTLLGISCASYNKEKDEIQ